VTSRKLALRAKIGILVSFKGNKIYYVYVPGRRDIVRTLHVTFNKNSIITSISSAKDETPKETLFIITKGNRNCDIEENPSTNIINMPKISINRDKEKICTLNHDNTLLLDDDDFADTKETLRVTKLSNDDEQGVTVPKLNTQTNVADVVKHDNASSTALKKRGRLLSSKNK
jgi:hypothetical protein